MKFLATGNEMQEIDRTAIDQIGIPGIVLMERAAMAVAGEIENRFPIDQRSGQCVETMADIKVLIIVEKGNNGGDGLAVARILSEKGYQTDVYCIGQIRKATESFAVQQNILEQLGIKLLDEYPDQKYDIIVDAIFGVGLKRDIRGIHQKIIEKINDTPAYVVSIDIPSGVSATTGQVMNVAVKADLTVTMGLMKVGMVLYPGCACCGEIRVKDIGFPGKAVDIVMPEIYTYEEKDLMRLPKRAEDGNKGTFGKVAVIAGSQEISGAACLAASAAYRVGSGMVKVYTHKDNRVIVGGYLPEALMKTYQDEKTAALCAEDACAWADVILIGPGIGTGKEAECMLKTVLEDFKGTIVVDADGLNLLSAHKDLLTAGEISRQTGNISLVITPHIKEMSRLTGKTVAELKEAPVRECRTFAEAETLVCVLKDARTCVSAGGVHTYMNTSGNDGMATAGSGDVLAGMIAGLSAGGISPAEAARLGVYIHGLAGDRAKKRYGKAAVTAGSLIDEIGPVMSSYV